MSLISGNHLQLSRQYLQWAMQKPTYRLAVLNIYRAGSYYTSGADTYAA